MATSIQSFPVWAQWALSALGIVLVIAVIVYGVTVRLDPSDREDSRDDE